MTSEIDGLREEIEALRILIAGFPDHHQRGPLGKTYLARLAQLYHEAAELELVAQTTRLGSAGVNVRLDGEGAGVGRIKALVLAELVAAMQTLVTALGQAVEGRPTTRGMVPIDIQRQTTLEAFAFAPGSFIVQLVADPDARGIQPRQLQLGQIEPSKQEHLAVRALGELDRLLSLGHDEAELRSAFSRLKGRVLSAYDNLLQVPEKCGAELDISFYDPRSESRWAQRVSGLEATAIRRALSREGVREEFDTEFVVGVLVGANHRTGIVEIGLEPDSSLQGRTNDPSLLNGAVIGGLYTFQLRPVSARDSFTNAPTWSYELVSAPEPA